MRILILTRFYLNGQTTHVLSLCLELSRLGHKPFLVITNFNHPTYIQWLRKHMIAFITKSDLNSLDQLVKRHKFDVIHNHSSHTLKLALDLGTRNQIPVIVTCHYLDFQPLPLLSQADGIITISPEMHNKLSLPKNKTIMIENGIDSAKLKPSFNSKKKACKPEALIITRMTDRREPYFFLLVDILLEQNWNIRSVGNWRPNQKEISISDWKVDPTHYYQAADLVIGTGRSIREGMAAGACALVLGDYLDGLVTKKNVTRFRYYNFSGRATKHKPNRRKLTRCIASLSKAKYLSKLQEFSYAYAQEHFSQEHITKRIIDFYQIYRRNP